MARIERISGHKTDSMCRRLRGVDEAKTRRKIRRILSAAAVYVALLEMWNTTVELVERSRLPCMLQQRVRRFVLH